MRILKRFGLFILPILLFGEGAFGGDPLETAARKAASQGYDRDFIELVEMVYGEGFLSQGGEQLVEGMIGDLDLSHLQVLDIGSGLGGACIFLAKKYPAQVIGIDPQKGMIDLANGNLLKQKEKLKGELDFIYMESASNLQNFPDDSFDVIFSIEALLHIPFEVKPKFFAEIYRVLKPGGHVMLMDWMRTDRRYSENTRKMMELDGVAYNLIPYETYLNTLEEVGFAEIDWEDTTSESAMLSQQNVDTILASESMIRLRYDENVFQESLTSWQWQRDAFQMGELRTGIFKARKF